MSNEIESHNREKVPFLALLWLYSKAQFRLMTRTELTLKESLLESLKVMICFSIFTVVGLILTIIIAAIIGFVRTIFN